MEVKDRIQEKATELFMRYGVKSITMDEIASQLGVSKKTIYQYFADKDELVNAVIEWELNGSETDCLASIVHAENAIHEEFLVQDMMLESLQELNPVALHDMEKFHPAAFQKFVQHKNSFVLKMVANNLQNGIREELYRPEIRVDIMSKFRVDSIFLGLSTQYLVGTSYTQAEWQQELFKHYLLGISTSKGHKLIHRYLQERQEKAVHSLL
jgi:TetR/AcrR family transcriptional regulator, cholesterol catabolism regulator